MKKIAILLAMFATSCTEPLAIVDSGNDTFSVKLMGHIPDHGCDIYSIQGGSAYAVICPTPVLPVDTTEEHLQSCGKSCTTTVRTPTTVRSER
jgi:hypothetical protein